MLFLCIDLRDIQDDLREPKTAYPKEYFVKTGTEFAGHAKSLAPGPDLGPERQDKECAPLGCDERADVHYAQDVVRIQEGRLSISIFAFEFRSP